MQNLRKIYAGGTEALKGVNLDINEGDFFGLLGANGAGKTTLIGIITSLVNKTSGQISIFGENLKNNSSNIKKKIGVVPQEFNFNMFEQVENIILAQAGYFGIARRIAKQESEQLLKTLGLWTKRFAIGRSLSGGMKRRLMMARALIHKPQLLILDEPTAGVDVELRLGMWEYLRELNRQGTTILLTTHYLEEAEQLCRNVAIIKEGKIVRNVSIKELLSSLEQETYVVHIQEPHPLNHLQKYHPRVIDDITFEVVIQSKDTLNHFIAQLTQENMIVTDIRPKGQRLERLFLSLLKEDS